MRASVANLDGTANRIVAGTLVDGPDAWTQFAGWSPDGKQAIISRGWQSPENARWEEEHKSFRMEPGQWALDSYLLDLESGLLANVTGIDRVSHYNGGLFFLPDGKRLGFTPLMNGRSRPFVMDLDGRNKQDVSGKEAGFAYGYSSSPDGQLISYHEDYQIFIANQDGSSKRRIETGNSFNFGPQWSADGNWLLFLSGVRGNSHPYVVKRDGTGLKKLADLNGYQGWILFLDVPDFHEGSSDVPVWSIDGHMVFYTAKTNQSVEIYQASLDGTIKQLTKSAPGTLHYHLQPAPNGESLLFGSKRQGVRQIYTMSLADHTERRITHLQPGHAAMWPHWRPSVKATKTPSKVLPLKGTTMRIKGHEAFLIAPPDPGFSRTKRWVWYAPTLTNLPGKEERWMFEQLLKEDIAIAGIDVGESYGSPDGQTLFSELYEELVQKRGYDHKPVLLGRSRGGLMTLSWAVNNPDKVGGFAGIYPVCNLVSYPGLARASGAYHLSESELKEHLGTHNPIENLQALAQARIPLFAIHGDKDTVVPLDANSGLLKARYEALGGGMQLIVPPGQDHNMWEGFFQSQELIRFIVQTLKSPNR
ncbi:MAG: PD40 domain-containing protein [Verrucomicrobiales bacterium]|nr:PD40 domain-containing protein [Verrucomicrobiales bacterium]